MVRGEPRQALVQAVAGRRARRLHVPVAVAYPRQAELLLDLVGFHCWEERERESTVSETD